MPRGPGPPAHVHPKRAPFDPHTVQPANNQLSDCTRLTVQVASGLLEFVHQSHGLPVPVSCISIIALVASIMLMLQVFQGVRIEQLVHWQSAHSFSVWIVVQVRVWRPGRQRRVVSQRRLRAANVLTGHVSRQQFGRWQDVSRDPLVIWCRGPLVWGGPLGRHYSCYQQHKETTS